MRWMNYEKASKIYEEVKEVIADAKEAGFIYKVDYDQWKEKASRAIETHIQFAKDKTYLTNEYDPKKNETDLYYGLGGLTVTNFPTKKLAKELTTDDTAFYKAVQDVVDVWAEISDGFKELKNMIKTGRKPSTTPRKTKERTIENTGTCPCCHRNIKLDGGKIVHHGFEISHGYRNGTCPGVGFKPWEVSVEGKVALLQAKIVRLGSLVQTKDHYINARELVETIGFGKGRESVVREIGTPEFKRLQDFRLMKNETEIEHIQSDIARLTKEIAGWVRQTLPGEK